VRNELLVPVAPPLGVVNDSDVWERALGVRVGERVCVRERETERERESVCV